MKNRSGRYKWLFHFSILMTAWSMALMNSSTVFAWGDSGGGRQSHTVDEINKNVLGEAIIFNTISNGEQVGGYGGDEKNFVSAKKSSEDPKGIWQGNEILIEDGEYYTIRLYAHNNNPNGYDSVAEDTHACFSVPQESEEEIEVNGFIISNNAEPNEYWDRIKFISDRGKFHLEYVYGSATLYNSGIGKDGLKLSDEIVTKAHENGTIIGYDSLDGCIPGGYQYDSYITIQVLAIVDHEFTVDTKVRLFAGDKTWNNYINAEVGDTVEFQIEYENTSTIETQADVMVRNILPKNIEYIKDSTKLWNSNHQNGAVLSPDGDIVSRGVNIGSYLPGGNAYIRFYAKVVNENPENNSDTLASWAQASVKSDLQQDYVLIILKNKREFNAEIILCCIFLIIIFLYGVRRGCR